MADSSLVTFSIRSHSNPSQPPYKVTLDPISGQWYCSCKGYGYRRLCSHIKEATQLLDKQTEQLVASLEVSTKLPTIRQCTSCQAQLTGTHAFLDRCAACIRAATFA